MYHIALTENHTFTCDLMNCVLTLYGAVFRELICISRSVSHAVISKVMCLITFLGVQATEKNCVGTEFPACRTEIDRMNVTSVGQFLSL